MPHVVEDEVLVDLVGHHEQVSLAGEPGDRGELLVGEDGAGGVVRTVDQQQLGARGDGGSQGVDVEPEVGRAQRDRHPHAAGHGDGGGVGVVVRLQRYHLVAGVDQRQHRRGDGLGRAGGNENFAVGVELDAVEALLVSGDRRTQLRNPRPGAYWLRPARIAAAAASMISAGPSTSGNPWPRLIESVARASADISAKIVVPRPSSRVAALAFVTDRSNRYVHLANRNDTTPEAVRYSGRGLRSGARAVHEMS